MGVVGVYRASCAERFAATKKQKAESRKQKCPPLRASDSGLLLLSAFCFLLLIIWRSSADPVPDQLRLRVGQIGSPLRHTIPRDAGAGDLPVQVRVGRIARRDALQRWHLDACDSDRVRVRAAAGAEDHAFL